MAFRARKVLGTFDKRAPGKSRKPRPAYSLKLASLYVKGNIKITARLRVSRLLRFEGTKRITSPEVRSKSFGTLDRRSGQFLESPENFSREAIGKPQSACIEKLIFQHVFNVGKTRFVKIDGLEPRRC